jgi:membrane protein implicated in regulation of membrane protease activity
MDDWVFWIIAAAILAAGEVMTMGFFLAPFAIGCLAAALASGVGAGVGVSIAIATAVSVALLAGLRPLAKAHMRTPPAIRTGTARLIGQQALVLDRVTQDTGGSVKIEGETWSARSLVEGQVFEPGDRVSVVEIRGAMALVTE